MDTEAPQSAPQLSPLHVRVCLAQHCHRSDRRVYTATGVTLARTCSQRRIVSINHPSDYYLQVMNNEAPLYAPQLIQPSLRNLHNSNWRYTKSAVSQPPTKFS